MVLMRERVASEMLGSSRRALETVVAETLQRVASLRREIIILKRVVWGRGKNR